MFDGRAKRNYISLRKILPETSTSIIVVRHGELMRHLRLHARQTEDIVGVDACLQKYIIDGNSLYDTSSKVDFIYYLSTQDWKLPCFIYCLISSSHSNIVIYPPNYIFAKMLFNKLFKPLKRWVNRTLPSRVHPLLSRVNDTIRSFWRSTVNFLSAPRTYSSNPDLKLFCPDLPSISPSQ